MREVLDSPAAVGTQTPACVHGGAFFQAVGESFDDLQRRHAVINADVLDAWFPPAPAVLDALRDNLDWLARTSPPTTCDGLVRTIAAVRDVPADCVVPGAGSSDLIYRAFLQWLSPAARVLLLDPTYGEYAHVCDHVLGCEIERFPLERDADYQIDLDLLQGRLRFGGFDAAVIVNPNNPTGQHVPRETLERVLRRVPSTTLIWIDEAYLEYVGADQSLERFATTTTNVVVCKSLSKAYALSGMRAAYLCGAADTVEPLRAWTPPWVIGLPAQVAAVRALESPVYYAEQYRETRCLRRKLADAVRRQHPRWDVLEGSANFVLGHLPARGPRAAEVVHRCQERGLFLRDANVMGTGMAHTLRIAVKDETTQERMLAILREMV